MNMDQLPLLLTVEEAAKVMRISRTGAYNAVAEGAVPAIRIGRTIRIPRDRLVASLGLAGPSGERADGRPEMTTADTLSIPPAGGVVGEQTLRRAMPPTSRG